MLKKENIIKNKTIDFSLKIIELYKKMRFQEKEYVISNQILKSGTSIGANIHESQEAISTKDFLSKLYIGLKEARETEYWLILIEKGELIKELPVIKKLQLDCEEIIKIITSIIKTKKENLRKECS